MAMSDDMQLLQEYASGNSEEAFATLVTRHINLVYSAALRRVPNPHQAEEVAQAVFVLLAKKAGRLNRSTVLSGWLYQTALLTASNFIRTETRRQHREQEAYMQSSGNEPGPDLWQQVAPILDDAMSQLSEADRNAIILRFFENKPLKDVGAALGTTDDAAKMRVNRAIEKMRGFIQSRGVTLSGAGLIAAIGENSVQAAPAGLAVSITAAAQKIILAGSTLTLAKGAIQFMTWTKVSSAVAVATIAIAAFEWQQATATSRKLADLQTQFEAQAKLNQTQQTEIAKLDQNNLRLAKQIESAAHDTAKARNHNAMASAAAAKKGGNWAEMMKDPAVLEMMRGPMDKTNRKQYAPLVKQLGLDDDQAEKFYKILLNHEMNGMEQRADLMAAGNMAGMKQLGEDLKKQMNASLEDLLGAGGFAQYQDFESTIGDRVMMERMKEDFVDNPLTDEQQQQLMQTMKSARSAAGGDGSDPAGGFSVANSGAATEQVIQRQQNINQQVLQQAAAYLSPAQLQTLGTSQSNMISMQQAGYTLAQKMYGIQPSAVKASQ
jgi:RNA polymerase sigma factor (sigma-70 family)